MKLCSLADTFRAVLGTEYTHTDCDASYAFKVEDHTLHIFFEWSNGKTDWKNNFDFPAKPYRDMKDKWYCHRGFLRVWKAIEPHLAAAIMDPNIGTIIIAGYSHGGAIAQLCHEYCRFHRPDCDVQGFGFAAPRVLWGHMSDRVNYRFLGFVTIRNKGDIVTHLPPAFFGFQHGGAVLTIGDGGYGCIDAHRPESYTAELDKIELEWMQSYEEDEI